MTEFSLSGAMTALVTPFSEDSTAIDFEAFDALIERQIAGGISGLVVCGTTAESPTLSEAEKREVLRRAVRVAAGRVPVMAGTGSNNTTSSVADAKQAAASGVQAVMVVVPYYNKPSQDGLVAHLSAVARSVDLPVVIYNIPGRASVSLEVTSLLRVLDACPNVVGLKDASGDVQYCQELLGQSGDRVDVMSGDDPLLVPLMSVGAAGVISVTSHLFPRRISNIIVAMNEGRLADARVGHFEMLPVHRALFLEPNPAPVKAAMAARGWMKANVRLPLVAASAETASRIAAITEGVTDQ